jgi:hypothetical protein
MLSLIENEKQENLAKDMAPTLLSLVKMKAEGALCKVQTHPIS